MFFLEQFRQNPQKEVETSGENSPCVERLPLFGDAWQKIRRNGIFKIRFFCEFYGILRLRKIGILLPGHYAKKQLNVPLNSIQ